ncbi:PspA-associated protein PspAB [Motilibacter aurantiacus]|uniref:PspA-associated protein PspAB n=1 Tax=Motilibacter aurantiacus TaxID=2714955 RepID=UPI00140A935C|nr:hypothetical protein [Motilibacter aurantiacus]NHC44908.1 hypothetical protein [Motilibacter aurantiacus]
MGLLDRLLGRAQPPPPSLDELFALPDAALTLETSLGLRPTGVGSVCFRAAEGAAFAQLETDVQALLDADGGPNVERSLDGYGFTWLTCRHDPGDMAGLVTALHAVNASLEAQGFGPALLCSLVAFSGTQDQRLSLVYLYKRGTFYPFAPTGHEQRDNALELQARGALTDLRVEPDLARWFPVWGAPGL